MYRYTRSQFTRNHPKARVLVGGETLASAAELIRSDLIYHVILLAGQSNIQGHTSAINLALDDAVGDIYQWGSSGNFTGRLSAAREPLSHITEMAGLMGFPLTFAKSYLNSLKINERILLVPCAMGGTGFSDNRWNPGDDLFQNAVERTNAALTAFPKTKLVAIFWQQGEKDADPTPMTKTAYAVALDAMVEAMRAGIIGAKRVPFLAGTMVEDWVNVDAGRVGIQEAIQELPTRQSNCVVVDASGLPPQADGIHFSEASMRTLGGRYLTALQNFTPTPESTAPVSIPQPLLHINFDDGTIADVSGNDVTLTTTVITVTDDNTSNPRSTKVSNHPGTNSGEQINANVAVPATYTKCAWVYADRTNAPNPNIISTDQADQHVFWSPGEDMLFSAGHSNFTDLQDKVKFSTNGWYHVAVTYDSGTKEMKLYKNGYLVNSKTLTDNFSGGGTPTRIGAYQDGTNNWSGHQDDLMVFGSVLTNAQIKGIADDRYTYTR